MAEDNKRKEVCGLFGNLLFIHSCHHTLIILIALGILKETPTQGHSLCDKKFSMSVLLFLSRGTTGRPLL